MAMLKSGQWGSKMPMKLPTEGLLSGFDSKAHVKLVFSIVKGESRFWP